MSATKPQTRTAVEPEPSMRPIVVHVYRGRLVKPMTLAEIALEWLGT